MTTSAENVLPQDAWRHWVTPLACLRAAILVTLFILVFWGTIRHGIVDRWMNDPNWSHGWLIPLFSLYFLATRRGDLARVVVKPNYLGAVVLALSLAAFLISRWWLRMGYPQSLAMICGLGGLALLLGGWGCVRVVWFPILFLILAIPLPQSIYVAVTFQLQKVAAFASAAVLPILIPGLHTDSQAVVIDYVLPGRAPGQLNVEEACSGMRSTMAFVAIGVAMAYLHRRPIWQRVVMVTACIPIAIFCNAVRVTVTGWLQIQGYEQLARGTAHEVLGLIMFGMALGLFSLLGYVLSHLWVDVPNANAEALS